MPRALLSPVAVHQSGRAGMSLAGPSLSHPLEISCPSSATLPSSTLCPPQVCFEEVGDGKLVVLHLCLTDSALPRALVPKTWWCVLKQGKQILIQQEHKGETCRTPPHHGAGRGGQAAPARGDTKHLAKGQDPPPHASSFPHCSGKGFTDAVYQQHGTDCRNITGQHNSPPEPLVPWAGCQSRSRSRSTRNTGGSAADVSPGTAHV